MNEGTEGTAEQLAHEIAYSMPPEENAKLVECYLYALLFTCAARAHKMSDGTWTERHEGGYEALRSIADAIGINIHEEGGE